MAVCIKCGAQITDGSAFCSNCGTRQQMQQQMHQQYQQAPQMQPGYEQPQSEASGERFTPTGNISAGYGINGGGYDGKKGGKGLIIALIAAITVLIVVIAVLGFMLLRDRPGKDKGNTGRTKVTHEASTEATTKYTTGTTSYAGSTDQSVMEVPEEDLAAMAGYYESREMPWVIFINADGSYQSYTLRTNIEETGTWEAVYADRGDGEMVKMVYLYQDDTDEDDNTPLIWIEEEHGFIIGPWEGKNGIYQHLDPKPYPKATDGDLKADAEEGLYRPVLQETYEIVRNGWDENADYSYLSSGLMESLMYPENRNLMESVGYLIEDISGDGIPELLIGETADYEYDNEGEKSFIFKAYTCRDGKLVEIFEGWGRSSYQWMGANSFFHYGSGGASNSLFARAHLSKDGTELIWDEVYLTDEVFPDGLGIFYNTTGSSDSADSEKLDITQNEFWEIMHGMEDACKIIPFTPIGEFEP